MGKGAGAKAAKADSAAEKAAAAKAQAEAAEEAKWSKGAKGKAGKDSKAEKEDKAKEAVARKQEAARLLEEEEANLPSKPKAAAKKSAPPAKKASPAASKAPSIPDFDDGVENSAYSASGIDNALDMLDLANSKNDKATIGSKANQSIDTHPERRFKAAFEAYKSETLPGLRKEQPGLRLQQYQDIMYKDFQKHPDNPFNAATLRYDATKEDKAEAYKAIKKEKEDRLRG